MLALVLEVALAACGHPAAEQPAPGKPVEKVQNKTPDPTQAPTQAEDTRPAIAAFGDSLSAGFGVEPGKSYPDDLQHLLDAGGYHYRVVNLGVSGDTTTDGLERMPEVLALHPAIVILEFGANDGLRGLPVASTEKNLAAMMEAFRNGHVTVLLAGMTLPRNYGPEYIRSFEQVYADIAKQYKSALIPFLLEGVGGHPELTQADGLHPTAEGAAIVARNVMKYLQPMLPKSPR